MNEEERRQEILKAEATIQQLANEMARASGVASQAEAARVALDAARLDVIKSVDELNEVISTQKTTNTEAMAALNQAKKSLEDAISTLTDVGVHIDRIETHINEAVNEIRATAKIVGLIPNRLSAALSRELSQADKSIEERHTALMQVSENNSNKLKEISQSIDDNHRNISGVLDSKFSQIDTASEEKHSASMQVLENNSNKLKEISQSIDDNHRNISKLLDSLTRWGVVFAALTLLGVWISAIILLFRG
jgi:DNA repair exonuclease SbcCD ATPase subunit